MNASETRQGEAIARKPCERRCRFRVMRTRPGKFALFTSAYQDARASTAKLANKKHA